MESVKNHPESVVLVALLGKHLKKRKGKYFLAVDLLKNRRVDTSTPLCSHNSLANTLVAHALGTGFFC